MSANKAAAARDVKGSHNKWQPRGGRARAWLADHRRVASETMLFISKRVVSSFLVWLMIGVEILEIKCTGVSRTVTGRWKLWNGGKYARL